MANISQEYIGAFHKRLYERSQQLAAIIESNALHCVRLPVTSHYTINDLELELTSGKVALYRGEVRWYQYATTTEEIGIAIGNLIAKHGVPFILDVLNYDGVLDIATLDYFVSMYSDVYITHNGETLRGSLTYTSDNYVFTSHKTLPNPWWRFYATTGKPIVVTIDKRQAVGVIRWLPELSKT